MTLREQAARDLAVIFDSESGDAWPIQVTSPAGLKLSLMGLSNDIGQLIDPDTGHAITGRLASVALRIESLLSQGVGIPEGVTDNQSKPWLINFDDLHGATYRFKVKQSHPDRSAGLVVCWLEVYQ